MGTVSKNRKEVLKGPETVRKHLHPFQDGDTRFGLELECSIIKRDNFGLADENDHFRLVDKINEVSEGHRADIVDAHLSYSDEPGSHMAEIKDEVPLPEDKIGESSEGISRQIRCLSHLAQEADPSLIVSPFSVTAFATHQEARDNIIPPRAGENNYIDRPRTLMKAYEAHLQKEAQFYPVINTAVHITHSVSSHRHAFEMAKIQTALMPFSFIAFENRPPYQANSKERVTVHTGMTSRETLGGRGVIQDFVYAARDEDELIDGLIHDVLDTPMLVYLDHDGSYTAVPGGQEIKPMDMKGLGPQDVSQFEMAMSSKWGPIKFKLAKDKDAGMLHELRDFDSGPEVIKNVSLLFGMLIMNDEARQTLLTDLDEIYGIPVLEDPEKAESVIKANLDAAKHRGDAKYLKENHGAEAERFMDTPFGAKGHTMSDLLNETLLPMMEDYYEGRPESAKLDTWRFIANTGLTNAQFWYDQFDSMEEQRAAIREMTKDAECYHGLYASGKSFAQMHNEGILPGFTSDQSASPKQSPRSGQQPGTGPAGP